MRLALVSHNILRGDGQGRVVYELAARALREGMEVALLADRIDPELAARGASWLEIHPKGQGINLVKVREFAHRADRMLAEGPSSRLPTVIHAHGYTASRPHQVNTCHLLHAAWHASPDHTSRSGFGWRRLYHWLYAVLNRRWEARSYRAAEVVVAVSPRVRQQLLDIGVPECKLRVIANGVDLREFAPGPAARGELGLPPEVPLALFAGDIRIALKNLGTVLAALARVPGLHLAVAGDPQGSPFPAMAEKLGVATRVHFLGFRQDMPAVMRAADFLVCPSRYESFSLVLLEAMASGRAVVTARTVGAAELVTPDCGLVLDDPNDVAGLAQAMRTLAENPTQTVAMGAAARSVAEEFGWERMTGAYLKIYRSFDQS